MGNKISAIPNDQLQRRKSGCRIFLVIFLCVFLAIWLKAGRASSEETKDRFQSELIDDVILKRPLDLRGNVHLVGFKMDYEFDASLPPKDDGNPAIRKVCDAVCAALLALPEIDSVTIINSVSRLDSTRFRLVDKSDCIFESVIPQQPDSLRPNDYMSFEELDLTHKEEMQAGIVASQSLETAWRIRLSNTDCIIADRATTDPDFVIETSREEKGGVDLYPATWTWTYNQLPLVVERFEIRDASGTALIRRLFVQVRKIVYPIYPSVAASCGKLCFKFGWARETLRNTDIKEEFHPRTFLLNYTNIRRGVETVEVDQTISEALRRVLDDPDLSADDPVFKLTDTWMRSLTRASLTDTDKELLVDLIKDRRVTDFLGIWHAVSVLGADAQILADPIRDRIDLDYDKKEVVSPLSKQLPKIAALGNEKPDGSSRDAKNPSKNTSREHDIPSGPTESELAILQDPVKRMNADGLIIQQSDYGAAAVPLLVQIMREHMERTRDLRAANPQSRIPSEINPIDAAMVALCKIGPEAKSAVPELRRLRASWLGDSFRNDSQWHFTLARIGTPLDEIQPGIGSSMTPERYAKRLKYKLDNYIEQRDCKEMWM